MSGNIEEAKEVFENNKSISEIGSYIWQFLTTPFSKRGQNVEKNSFKNEQAKSSSDEKSLAIFRPLKVKNASNDMSFMNSNASGITKEDEKECPEENTFGKLLDNVVGFFKALKRINQFLLCSSSFEETNQESQNSKINPTSEDEIGQFSDLEETIKNYNIKTLDDALTYFDLSSELLKLETSLQALRQKEKSKKEHEDCFKEIDKKIQKLSLEYHPDKVISRGGSESEIATMQKFQSALNGLRTALNILNSAFMEDSDTDHYFKFYTKLSIGTVCNEEQMQDYISEVISKIDIISHVKQRYIISEIRKFLVQSKNCIRSYLKGDMEDFERARDAALLRLKYCIKGFEKLIMEIKKVEKQCKSEENMLLVLKGMASKSESNLKLLLSLEKVANTSLKGEYKFFMPKDMDKYFVLPLVSYTNVILMCNLIKNSTSILDKGNFNSETYAHFSNDLSDLYYLASYISGIKQHEKTVLEIMYTKQSIQRDSGQEISKEEIKLEFYQRVKNISESMESEFNVNDYNEDSMSDFELKNTLMREFQEKNKEVSNDYNEFQRKFQKLNEEHENLMKTMEAVQELDQEFKESLEQSKIFNELVSNFISEQL